MNPSTASSVIPMAVATAVAGAMSTSGSVIEHPFVQPTRPTPRGSNIDWRTKKPGRSASEKKARRLARKNRKR